MCVCVRVRASGCSDVAEFILENLKKESPKDPRVDVYATMIRVLLEFIRRVAASQKANESCVCLLVAGTPTTRRYNQVYVLQF